MENPGYRPYLAPGREPLEVGTSVVFTFDFTGYQGASAPTVLHLDPGTAGEHKINNVDPVYPQMARIAHIQGTVLISAIIDKQGNLENLRPASGHPILIQAALDAVKQWKYRPFTVNEKPVEVETVIKVMFRM